MNLELKAIFSADADPYPDDPHDLVIPLHVAIGEQGREGEEVFHFVAASPGGLKSEISEGSFYMMRGYILMEEFDWEVVHKAIQNLIDRARSRQSWDEVVSFFNRYGLHDSEDLGGRHYP